MQATNTLHSHILTSLTSWPQNVQQGGVFMAHATRVHQQRMQHAYNDIRLHKCYIYGEYTTFSCAMHPYYHHGNMKLDLITQIAM